MDNKFLPRDLKNNYQFIVTIRNLASVYHNASVEKMDHVFFNGSKIPLKPALIDFLKSRPCRQAITTAEWSRLLVDMGYNAAQINNFESLEVIPGEGTLVESLAAYAQQHPTHSIYTAMDTILKDYSRDPMFATISDMFQKAEPQVKALFAMAYHSLDTMHPLEAELNLLTAYYEPYFTGYRNPSVFEAGAKILGQLSQIVDELPTNISEIASSYVMLRTNQIRQYAHLNLENTNISESLQGFAAQLSAEFEFLQTQWEGKNLKQTFQTMLQPENVWLENLISSLEMSQDALERKKGANIRAAYLAIPCDERSQIDPKMSQPSLVRSSPIGLLKQALEESTARFTLFNTLTGRRNQHILSQNFQEEYVKALNASGAETDDLSDTETNSSKSGRGTPS